MSVFVFFCMQNQEYNCYYHDSVSRVSKSQVTYTGCIKQEAQYSQQKAEGAMSNTAVIYNCSFFFSSSQKQDMGY